MKNDSLSAIFRFRWDRLYGATKPNIPVINFNVATGSEE